MKVKIKTWDKMVDEFGVNADGAVNCLPPFVASMEGEMPLSRIIDIDIRASGCMMWYGWRISDEMIEQRFDGSDIKHQIKECLDTLKEDMNTAIANLVRWEDIQNHEYALETLNALRKLLTENAII